MKWSNLKNNICPKCGDELDPVPTGEVLSCSNQPDCDFHITQTRMEEIISNMNQHTECQTCGKPTNGFRLCWNCKQAEEHGDVPF